MNPLLLVLVLVRGLAGFFEDEDENEEEDGAASGCTLAPMSPRARDGSRWSRLVYKRCTPDGFVDLVLEHAAGEALRDQQHALGYRYEVRAGIEVNWKLGFPNCFCNLRGTGSVKAMER
jgi:hypothetical protein